MTPTALRSELVLRRNGTVLGRIAPGEKKLIGRAPAADFTVADPSVSRLHVRISWPADRVRPVIEDLQSANGVALNGTRIAQVAELKDGMSIELGELTIVAEVTDNLPPAVLDEGGTVRVRLFSESGPELEGAIRAPEQLRDLLLGFEARRRTGTLVLEQGRITFARGRVVDATTPTLSGMRALQVLARNPAPGRFRFELDVAPRECKLDASIRTLFEGERSPTERFGRQIRNLAS